MSFNQQRLYELVVRMHPAVFREEYGPEMAMDFADALRDGRASWALYWDALLSVGRQWVFHAAAQERAAQMVAGPNLLSGRYGIVDADRLTAFEWLRGLAGSVALIAIFLLAPTRTARSSMQPANAVGARGTTSAGTRSMQRGSDDELAADRLRRVAEARNGTREASPDEVSRQAGEMAATTAAVLGGRAVDGSGQRTAVAAFVNTHAQTPAPQLEVATVKPSDPAKEHLGLYWRQTDGFKREGSTLRGMIGHAYGVPSSVKGLVQGGPAWMLSDAFDVQVKVDPATTERWSKLPQLAVDEERSAVERELLAERFHLKVHREMREMPAFVLTVAKGGLKLQTPVTEKDSQAGVPQNRINIYGHGHWEGHSALLSNLSRSLMAEPEAVGRPIVDKTGLTGQYDFTLQWTSVDPSPVAAPAAPTDHGEQWPSLFTALEEQLGLKLKTEKEQIEVIVVDSVEKPSAN